MSWMSRMSAWQKSAQCPLNRKGNYYVASFRTARCSHFNVFQTCHASWKTHWKNTGGFPPPDVLTTKPVVTRARPSEATVGSAMQLICGGHAFTNSLGPSGTLFDALTSHFSPAPRLNHTLPALLSEIGTHVLLHTLFLVPMLLSNHRRISSHLAYIRIYNWVYKYICAWRNMRSKMRKIP